MGSPITLSGFNSIDFNQILEAVMQQERLPVDAPGRARVKLRVDGRDGRPLRFWSTSIDREDRWERRSGKWWIVPGKP